MINQLDDLFQFTILTSIPITNNIIPIPNMYCKIITAKLSSLTVTWNTSYIQYTPKYTPIAIMPNKTALSESEISVIIFSLSYYPISQIHVPIFDTEKKSMNVPSTLQNQVVNEYFADKKVIKWALLDKINLNNQQEILFEYEELKNP